MVNEPREVTVDEFAAGWAAGQPVVDVREPWEYAQGHVPGALPIPLKLLAEHLVDIPDGDTVYVRATRVPPIPGSLELPVDEEAEELTKA